MRPRSSSRGHNTSASVTVTVTVTVCCTAMFIEISVKTSFNFCVLFCQLEIKRIIQYIRSQSKLRGQFCMKIKYNQISRIYHNLNLCFTCFCTAFIQIDKNRRILMRMTSAFASTELNLRSKLHSIAVASLSRVLL